MSLGRIFCKDVSVLLFHNEFCKSQTNAGAVFGSVGAPIKPLKQMRQIFFCKPGSAVLNDKLDIQGIVAPGNKNGAILWRMLPAVFQHINHCLRGPFQIP